MTSADGGSTDVRFTAIAVSQTITGIGISPQTFTAKSAAGDQIGILTATLSGGIFSGAFDQVGCAPSSNYSIVGNNLKVGTGVYLSGGGLAGGVGSACIRATQTGVPSLTANLPITGLNSFIAQINAVDFDIGGDGVGWHGQGSNCDGQGQLYRNDQGNFIKSAAGTTGSTGGVAFVKGCDADGEWLQYTVTANSGLYSLQMAVGDPNGSSHWSITLDGSQISSSVPVVATSWWTDFAINTSPPFTIPSTGTHTIKLTCVAGPDPFGCGDVAWIKGIPASQQPPPPAPPQAVAAGYSTSADNSDFSQEFDISCDGSGNHRWYSMNTWLTDCSSLIWPYADGADGVVLREHWTVYTQQGSEFSRVGIQGINNGSGYNAISRNYPLNGYFECTVKMGPFAVVGPWFDCFMWGVQGHNASGGVFETDIQESHGGDKTETGPLAIASDIINWAAGPFCTGCGYASNGPVQFDPTQYHKYGALLQRVGQDTERMTFFIDDVQQGTPLDFPLVPDTKQQRHYAIIDTTVGCSSGSEGYWGCTNVPIADVSDNGAGTTRITVTTTSGAGGCFGHPTGCTQENYITYISGVGGATNANGHFRMDFIDDPQTCTACRFDIYEQDTGAAIPFGPGAYVAGTGTWNPIPSVDMYVKSWRVWSCVDWATTQCNGTDYLPPYPERDNHVAGALCSASTSCSATIASSQAGDLRIVGIYSGKDTGAAFSDLTSVRDDHGNVCTHAVNTYKANTIVTRATDIWYCPIAASVGSSVITATFSVAQDFSQVFVNEIYNAVVVNPDQGIGNGAAVTGANSLSMTTNGSVTATGEYVYSFAKARNFSAPASITKGQTQISIDTTNTVLDEFQLSTSASGSVTNTVTALSAPYGELFGSIAAFKMQ